MVRNVCEIHGVEWVIAVPHNIIGPRQKYDDPYRNVAAIMINRMLRGQQPIIYGDGQQRRCFSFVADVVALPGADGAPTRGASARSSTSGPTRSTSRSASSPRTIADLLDFAPRSDLRAGPPARGREATCSADKARRLLGYRDQHVAARRPAAMVEWIAPRGRASSPTTCRSRSPPRAPRAPGWTS